MPIRDKKDYDIPFSSLKDGMHSFQFEIDSTFFELRDQGVVSGGEMNVSLELEKKPGLMDLAFQLNGTLQADCDRCMSSLQFPIDENEELVVKITDHPGEDDANLIYLSPRAEKLNVFDFIYDSIALAMPSKIDCSNSIEEEGVPCDQEILNRLEGDDDEPEDSDEVDPRWNKLKDFLNN